MFNLGGMEILVILVVALLVLGPDKLPGFMRTVGKALGELRRVSTDLQDTVNTAITDDASSSANSAASSSTNSPAKAVPEPEATAPAEVSDNAPDTPQPRKRPLPRARRARFHSPDDPHSTDDAGGS